MRSKGPRYVLSKNIAIVIGVALLHAVLRRHSHLLPHSDTPRYPETIADSITSPGYRQSLAVLLSKADHADVQSALKAIFVQAGKQFDLTNTVTGQLTLKLDNQSMDTAALFYLQADVSYSTIRMSATTAFYHF